MCGHPAYQVNVFRKGLCVRGIIANFFRHPVESVSLINKNVERLNRSL